MVEQLTEDQRLLDRLRAILLRRALNGEAVSAETLAAEAEVDAGRLISLLETLIRKDHAAGRPLLAALAVSDCQDDLFAHRFFAVLRDLGRYEGPDERPEASEWLALEQDEAITRLQAEREAYAEMVYWLAGFMTNFTWETNDSANFPDLLGLEVYHGFQTAMENMSFLLAHIGILDRILLDSTTVEENERFLHNILLRKERPLQRLRRRLKHMLTLIRRRLKLSKRDDVGLRDSGRFRFVVPRDQVKRLACKAYKDGEPIFEEVLACFLENAVGYRSLPNCNTPFLLPSEYVAAMDALCRLGYASKLKVCYRWTGAIVPAMVKAGEWPETSPTGSTETEQCFSSEADDGWQNKQRKLMAAMPESVKARIISYFDAENPGEAIVFLYSRTGWKPGPLGRVEPPSAAWIVEQMYTDWLKENSPT